MVWYDDIVNTVKLHDFFFSMSGSPELRRAKICFNNYGAVESLDFMLSVDRVDELKTVFGNDKVLKNYIIEDIEKEGAYYSNGGGIRMHRIKRSDYAPKVTTLTFSDYEVRLKKKKPTM